MAYKSFRDPVEHIVDQYFQRKRYREENNEVESQEASLDETVGKKKELPEVPMKMLRNRDGKAYKFIYGELKSLEADPEADVVIWQEELIRDEAGKVIAIETTYPDGELVRETFVNEDGKFAGTEVG